MDFKLSKFHSRFEAIDHNVPFSTSVIGRLPRLFKMIVSVLINIQINGQRNWFACLDRTWFAETKHGHHNRHWEDQHLTDVLGSGVVEYRASHPDVFVLVKLTHGSLVNFASFYLDCADQRSLNIPTSFHLYRNLTLGVYH